MPKKPDLVPGTRFHQLTILGKNTTTSTPTSKKYYRSYYDCVCDCGNQHVVSRSDLKKSSVKSCGCLRRSLPTLNFKFDPGVASFNNLYGRIKRGATFRGLEFSLTKIEHYEIIVKNCYYCNAPPAPYNLYMTRKGPLTAGGALMHTAAVQDAWVSINGVDRKDPKQGYIISNSVPCCTPCNYGKLDYTEAEYIEHCKLVSEYQQNKGIV